MKKSIYLLSTVIIMMLLSNLTFGQIQITSTTNASSMTNCDGSATVSANGTAGPFYYQWSNGSTSTTATQLCSGVYHVTVTNAYECETVLSVTISVDCDEDYDFTIGSSVFNTCLSSSDGRINTRALSESRLGLQYSYQWSNGSSSPIQNNLSPGYYCVTVTSSYNGQLKCQQVECFIVGVYWPQITADNITTSCYGQSTGGVDISVGGASSPYTYQWSNGSTSEDLTNVAAGTYTVTATDATGCSWAETYTVPSYTEIFISNTTEVTCPGYSVGEIDMTVSGGKPPYSYQWSNGSTSSNLTGLSSGTYTLSMTDDNGCTETQSVTVNTVATTEAVDPNDCRYSNTFCNGDIVATTNHGTYLDNNPLDCRYLNEYCQYNNQLFATNVAMPGLEEVTYGANCVVDYICSDGTLYSTYQGISASDHTWGINNFGEPYCLLIEYCDFPSLNAYYIWNVTNELTIGWLDNSPNCPLNKPTEKLFYCDGQHFHSECHPIAAAPPNNDDANINLSGGILIEAVTGDFEKDIKAYLSSELTSQKKESIQLSILENITVFPNPFDEEINIKINSDTEEVVNIALNDALGKTLMSRNYQLTEGEQMIRIVTSVNLPKGIYFLTIEYQNGQKESVKIMH